MELIQSASEEKAGEVDDESQQEDLMLKTGRHRKDWVIPQVHNV